ncbi:tetratricopeptide repeat protein [Snuella sedimenti]|uniref:Cell surface protein n=1 Tax=Snuella sedimenti TaxID=2798802 RepID=A0A8J7LTN4_9FLAO|nr:cell surface protein [Snuella sedimenti]MBJ6368571.1 cell surface protein [Snuella sedimenti]
MNLQYTLLLCMLLSLYSCTTASKRITDSHQYNAYLDTTDNTALETAQKELSFWKEKLETAPEQFPYYVQQGNAYSTLFSVTGTINYLKNAEESYLKANELTKYSNCTYLKALASNYISQHKFKLALNLLTKAELIGEKLKGTQKMLFDVHLELGNYKQAKTYLNAIENRADFDYLIRLAKWSDHRGNLNAAIKYLEQAKEIAERSNIASTKQWIYTNLADFYGHAGNIEASYNHYLKALELNPNEAYAKKGIAWIVYSYEKNPDEALRILNSVTANYFAPDYYLLKAEIAEYKKDTTSFNKQLELYHQAVSNTVYGAMYNKHNVLLFAENPNKLNTALTLAQEEVIERPTPESYDLLAWTYYKKGYVYMALEIIEKHVVEKTFEPETLYHIAEIYKAADKTKQLRIIKHELLSSSYELGPLIAQKIDKL